MKISKRKIEELRESMKIGGEECYGTEEVVLDTVIDILNETESEVTQPDEVGLTDGTKEFSTLDDFVREFWDRSVDLFLNFILSEDN